MIRLPRGEYFGSPGSTTRVAGLRITEATYDPQTRVPRHAHEQAYLCLVTSGGFEERSRNHAAVCGPGAVVWHPAGEVHEDVFGSRGGGCVNIEFTDDWLQRLDASGGSSWTHLRGGAASWLAARIREELTLPDSVSSLAVEGLMCALLAEVRRSSPHNGARKPAWLERSVELIRAEYPDALTVTELAAQAGVHRSQGERSPALGVLFGEQSSANQSYAALKELGCRTGGSAAKFPSLTNERIGTLTEQEARDALVHARQLTDRVRKWLSEEHPKLKL